MATATTLARSGSIAIPTKRHDGASQTEPQDEDQDAFSRYSNDVLRMKELLLFPEESADDDLDAVAKINEAFRGVGLSGPLINTSRNRGATPPKRRKANSTKPVAVGGQQGSARKTRLSWELHPSLLLHDMMEELEALENSHYIASEQGEDLEAMSMLFGGQDPAGEDGPPQLRQDQAVNGVATIEDEDEEDDK